jgi:hypothetical protein
VILQSTGVGQSGEQRFVIKLDEHLQLAAQLAENFGNAQFQAPEPRREFLYTCRWHDRGWRDLDENPPLDPRTGLPYDLGETPVPLVMLTSATSPHHNEAVHPYCGLLDSMHIYGLYNGRFGISNWVGLDSITAEHRPMVETMLSLEHQRQERLRAQLAADPETAAWVEEPRLWANYKLLQFFDSFALYFQMNHASKRRPRTFRKVPKNLEHDADLVVDPEGDATYSLRPYPFGQDPFEVQFDGRFLKPVVGKREQPDMTAVMRDTPVVTEKATLIAG